MILQWKVASALFPIDGEKLEGKCFLNSKQSEPVKMRSYLSLEIAPLCKEQGTKFGYRYIPLSSEEQMPWCLADSHTVISFVTGGIIKRDLQRLQTVRYLMMPAITNTLIYQHITAIFHLIH